MIERLSYRIINELNAEVKNIVIPTNWFKPEWHSNKPVRFFKEFSVTFRKNARDYLVSIFNVEDNENNRNIGFPDIYTGTYGLYLFYYSDHKKGRKFIKRKADYQYPEINLENKKGDSYDKLWWEFLLYKKGFGFDSIFDESIFENENLEVLYILDYRLDK